MSVWRRLFSDHPASVNESYGQHLVNAMGFSFRMIWGGITCLVHAVIPGVCCTKGSDMICELHEKMIINRRALAESGQPELQSRRAA